MAPTWLARLSKSRTSNTTIILFSQDDEISDEDFHEAMDKSPGVNRLKEILTNHAWHEEETLPFETLEDHMIAAYLIAREKITPPAFVKNRIYGALKGHYEGKASILTQDELSVLCYFSDTTKNLPQRPELPYGEKQFHKTVRRTGQDAERMRNFAASCLAELTSQKNTSGRQ